MFEFYLSNTRLIADISGALFWPEKQTVIFSDLHLEKGSWFAKQNVFLPPYDTLDTLNRVEKVVNYFKPSRVISLGDSFHDDTWKERISKEQIAKILNLTNNYEWFWIQGNHDPCGVPSLGGINLSDYLDPPLTFRHEAKRETTDGEVSGHFHPKAKIKLNRKSFSDRCFISDEKRVILPAFGSFTGGLNVMDKAISSFFRDDFKVFLLGSKVRQFPKTALIS
jgi:DNA ligase-associated metallophosphoesterase